MMYINILKCQAAPCKSEQNNLELRTVHYLNWAIVFFFFASFFLFSFFFLSVCYIFEVTSYVTKKQYTIVHSIQPITVPQLKGMTLQGIRQLYRIAKNEGYRREEKRIQSQLHLLNEIRGV